MRHASIVGFATITILCACGDSTGPAKPAVSTIALRLDSLYQQACVAGLTARCSFLGFFVTPAAVGARPSPVAVTTSSGTEIWQGFVRETFDTNSSGMAVDSSFIVMAYADNDLTTAVLALVSHVNTAPVVISNLLTADSVVSAQQSASGIVTTNARGGACVPTPGLYMNTGLPGADCTVGSFGVLISVAFAAESLHIGPATMNGIRETPPVTASGQSLPVRRANASTTPFTKAALFAEP